MLILIYSADPQSMIGDKHIIKYVIEKIRENKITNKIYSGTSAFTVTYLQSPNGRFPDLNEIN